jgi:hypothetical protein
MLLDTLHRHMLARVALAEAADSWYRAASIAEVDPLRELDAAQLLHRRAVSCPDSTVYEYRLSPPLRNAMVPAARARLQNCAAVRRLLELEIMLDLSATVAPREWPAPREPFELDDVQGAELPPITR